MMSPIIKAVINRPTSLILKPPPLRYHRNDQGGQCHDQPDGAHLFFSNSLISAISCRMRYHRNDQGGQGDD